MAVGPTIRVALKVLGTTRVSVDGDAAPLRLRERQLLGALAIDAPAAVDQLRLSESLWLTPPPSEAKTLQNHVARLRRALGSEVVVTDGASYSLGSCVRLDLIDFQEARARALLATRAGDLVGARLHWEDALRLVAGEPFGDLEATTAVRAARRRWQGLIDDSIDEHLLVLVRLGDHPAAEWEAAGHVGTRERRAVISALAFYRGDRRLDALRVLHQCREALRESGLEAGSALRRVERAMLADDPALLTDAALGFVAAAAPDVVAADTAGALVGRDAELMHLDAVSTAVRVSGDGALLALVGPSGSGKSALAGRAELLARVAGWEIVHWRGDGPPQVPPSRPLLVVFDDPGDAAASVWPVLAAQRSPGVLVLVCSRHRPPADAGFDVIEVGSLDTDSAVRLVQLALGRPVDAADPFVAAVVDRSGGLPSLVIELAVAGAPSLERDAEADAWMVRHVVGALQPAALTAAVVVAVAGRPVQLVDVLSVCRRLGVAPSAGDTADCVARRVLAVEPGGMRARDHTVVAALLADASEGELDALHRAWVEHLDETNGDPVAAAHHATAIAGWPLDDALRRHDAAARFAFEHTRYEAADHHARAALVVARQLLGADHPEVLRREIDHTAIRRSLVDVTYHDEQWRLVDRVRAVGEPSNLLHLVGLMCAIGPASGAGQLDERLAALVDDTLARPAEPGPRALAATRAAYAFSLSDAARSRRYAHQALVDSAAAGDDEVRLFAVQCADLGLGHPDDWPLRRTLGMEAMALAERTNTALDRAGVLQLLFSGQLQYADPTCRATLDRLQRFATEIDRPMLHWINNYLQAALAHVEARLDECEASIVANRSTVPLAASRLDAVYYGQLMAVRVAQGRLGEMGDDLDRLVAEQPTFHLWRGVRCWQRAVAGDLADAARLLDEVDDGHALAPDVGWAAGAYAVGRAAAMVGDPQRAARVLELLSPYRDLMAWMGHGVMGPFALALAELSLAAGRVDDARAHLATAHAVIRRLHAPVFDGELRALSARFS